jgi:geranylgeranyl pyrophosphate synthase
MSAVQAVVDAGGAEALKVMERVEHRMGELAGGHGPLLERFAGDTIAAGGKRLRPLLVCLCAGVPVPESDGLVRAAVAVELVHAATLVHDDVLDGSPLRRGRPTVVASGGRLAATATGDLLFSRAFAELAARRSGDGRPADDRAIEAVRVLARACSELAAGELMQRSDAWEATVAVERYLERCRLKTAVLFRAACQLGALEGVAGAITGTADRGDPTEQLGTFGERIGIAFQILDDVLDVAGPPERTGKPRGADLLDGTVTLPLILARQDDPDLAATELRSVTTPQRAAELCDRIAATGALESAKLRALEFVAGAKALLPDLPERQRAALELVADGVVDRYA